MPARLPGGFSITDKRINVKYSSPGKIRLILLEFNLRTEDWAYSIDQRRATPEDTAGIATSLTNYDPASVKPTCMQRISPEGQRYRLCHWIDYGRISVFEVKLVKDNTFLRTNFPATLQKPIPLNELDTYVDSFEPADPEGIPIMNNVV